ncbi:MAG TPA: aminotransferase class V-fold PLP-dependent enzyme [Candidatus Thermoplasmatota archaeon]|nr:aminotransferase class V-fold PLP-dependent enzyme [Candidatus Thermoplasmatota archaeon]
MTDWSAEFPGLRRGTYLNSCAHGLLPRRVRAAIDRHLDAWETSPDWGAWGESVESARRAFARTVGARDDEVSVQANASSGIAAVLSALPSGGRDEIATAAVDFPTAPFLAERQRPRGLRHVHVPAPDALDPDAWARRVGGRTALAVIPAVASFSGHRLDVAAYAKRARDAGAMLMVDAFQACGTYPIDVRRLDVDFLVTGVYKWLLAPAGLAFLYARRDRHDLLPTTGGWLSAREPYAFDPFGEPAPDARRFQSGGASVVGCAAAAESLRLLEEVGLGRIERDTRALMDRVFAGARERGFEVLTPEAPAERASIVTLRVPHLDRALAACAREGVVVNSRLGGIRVSPHFYNRPEDVDRLFATLDAALA